MARRLPNRSLILVIFAVVTILPILISVNHVSADAATSTVLSCAPASIAVNEVASCTATVSNADPAAASAPSGSVSWSTDSSGVFSDGSCTLDAAGSCQSIPLAVSEGSTSTGINFFLQRSEIPIPEYAIGLIPLVAALAASFVILGRRIRNQKK